MTAGAEPVLRWEFLAHVLLCAYAPGPGVCVTLSANRLDLFVIDAAAPPCKQSTSNRYNIHPGHQLVSKKFNF